jgi:hypothetical protein
MIERILCRQGEELRRKHGRATIKAEEAKQYLENPPLSAEKEIPLFKERSESLKAAEAELHEVTVEWQQHTTSCRECQ